jgi:CTP-dependent riboflavin kinase
MDSIKRTLQNVMDVTTTYLYKGGEVAISAAVVAANPEMFPKMMVDIVSVLPVELRNTLYFRSGEGFTPLSQHAGQKERITARVQSESGRTLVVAQVAQKPEYGALSKKVVELFGKSTEKYLDCRELVNALGITAAASSGILSTLHKKGLLEREEIKGRDRREPRYQYRMTSPSEVA